MAIIKQSVQKVRLFINRFIFHILICSKINQSFDTTFTKNLDLRHSTAIEIKEIEF